MRAPTADEARLWWGVVGETGVVDGLRALYDEAQRQTALAAPVCSASGRCCDFGRAGHDLFVTGLEAAFAVRGLPEGVGLDAPSLESAVARGTCPFLLGKGCLAHAVRPGGCRGYFCDPTRAEWSVDLSEHVARGVRRLHDEHGVPYLYSEWRVMLGGFVDAGLSRPVVLNTPGAVRLRVSAARRV